MSLMMSRCRAGTLRAGDFVVLDIEASDKTSPAAVASWCKSWLTLVQQLMGLPKQRVWVYTGAWFWNPQAGGSAAVGDHPLWVSGYVSGHPPMPKVPALSLSLHDYPSLSLLLAVARSVNAFAELADGRR